ncbi:putative phospholipase protein [Cupriavidus sp. U2]|uniref:phospholipase D-like domain-containing protein n=1 Tax=Cupriavidus sp. U2 TaxID=2920269 RepID=UPI00129DEF13|nr:phospholipase D-like domain-containing protein [Cupriavidus sp. U2]KAI3591142.1 putative phospholipase protein [Cupriavidus sp. U2]
MSRNPITTPIALSHTRTATIALKWFVERSEYDPAQCTFKPLVNGEEAFGEVYDAILAARRSVDIICWGFQPSMYFKRGHADVMTIGELLAHKGAQGVKVRLLCWQDDLAMAAWSENNAPGNNLATYVKPHLPDWMVSGMAQRDYQSKFQREFDRAWYARANGNNVTRGGSLDEEAARRVLRRMARAAGTTFLGIEFATRGFSLGDRAEIAYRTLLQGDHKESDGRTKAKNAAVMTAIPTHHQKMVVIDYEEPEHAVGFVMGHNMLDTYWDRDDHSFHRQHPRFGRNGLHPRQDISARVAGPVLKYLNKNFCEAWDGVTGQRLMEARQPLARRLTLRRDGNTPVVGQLLRTNPQGNRFDIESLYLQAVNNVTRFIYIENQYFRLPMLAEKIKQAVAAQLRGGRDLKKHGPIYLFVVTNSSDEGMGPGALKTYRMLEALGKADAMPAVAKLEREDARQADLRRQHKEAGAQARAAKQDMDKANDLAHIDKAFAIKRLHEARERFGKARQKQADLEAEMAKPAEEVGPPPEIEGLKVHVCTLVAPDSPPGKWDYVYVHSKLMIVDDVFMTLGSANINTRSMIGDSELNICHEHSGVTTPLRRRLWEVHTKGKGAQEDVGEAFEAWTSITDKNWKFWSSGKEIPYASLVRFHRDSPKRTNMD